MKKELTKTLRGLVCLILTSFSITCTVAQTQTCWATSDGSDNVQKFTLNGNTRVNVGSSISLGAYTSVEAGALNLAGDTLFLMNLNDFLYIPVNAVTPAVVLVTSDMDGAGIDGSYGTINVSDWDAAAVDTFGNIWVASSRESGYEIIAVVNTRTGLIVRDFFGSNIDYIRIPVRIQNSIKATIDAMDFDPLTNRLFANINTGNGTAGGEVLYVIDQFTGDTSRVGISGIGDLEGMTFDALGRLLVTTGANSVPSSDQNTIYWLDLNDASVVEVAITSTPGTDTETLSCLLPQGLVEMSGYVFGDLNRDTTYNGSDTAVRNYKVRLYSDINGDGIVNGADALLDSILTNLSGYYAFRQPYTSGTVHYTIISSASQLPANTNYTTNNLERATFTTTNTLDINNNFGFADLRNLISGYVFKNNNLDTVYNGGDQPKAGVRVVLYRDVNNNGRYDAGTDTPRDSVTTLADGSYGFRVSYSGSGTDRFLTLVRTSTLGAADSLVTDNIETQSFTGVSQQDLNNNFGVTLVTEGSNWISGKVFRDVNTDTIYNGSDVGKAGVLVCLYGDVNRNGIFNAGTDTLITSALTDANGNYIFKIGYNTSTRTVSKTVSVIASADDARQQDVGQATNLNETSTNLGEFYFGARFQSVGIPVGSTITSASVSLYRRDGADTDAATTLIYGEDVDNSATFTTAVNNISGRANTSAQTPWVIPTTGTANAYMNTPSITSVVQEIVDRGGWSRNNAISIIFENTTFDDGFNRRIRTWDLNQSTSTSPILNLTFDTIFTERYITRVCNAPAGAVFTTDNVETAAFSSPDNVDANNNFGYTLDSTAFNIIRGTVFGDADSSETLNGGEQGVPSIGLKLYKDNNCDGIVNGADAVRQTTTSAANGTYNFDVPYQYNTGTYSQRIANSSDDADQQNVGDGGQTTNNALRAGGRFVGMRFTNVSVPKNAVITSAYITVRSRSANTWNSILYAQAVDNAPTFTDVTNNISSRTATTANVSWNLSSVSDNAFVTSPNIKSLIQEVVNRSGWASNNALVIRTNDGSGSGSFDSRDQSAADAPLLVINYQIPVDSCYVVVVDTVNKPSYSFLTTNDTNRVKFTAGKKVNAGNDFGLWGGAGELPVEFLTFDALRNEGVSDLSWSTASELNNSHFDVERSDDGANFIKIGEVTGSGTTQLISWYYFTDLSPLNGTNYYRLRQVDFDGSEDYSAIRSVIFINYLNKTLEVYPNPADQQLHINWSTDMNIREISIISQTGQLLLNQQVENQFGSEMNSLDLDVSQFKAGMYFLQMVGTSESVTKKIEITR